ncbi:MAG: GDSL-type esterase/lipase family protein [Nannocystaceae bacterium]
MPPGERDEGRRVVADDGILDALPGSSGLAANEQARQAAANGNALGLFVPLENPGGTAMHRFFEALRQLEHADPGSPQKVRILAYGASHTQADIYTAYLRHYLQLRFGNGGRGFLPIARINRWHRQPNIKLEHHDGWVITHAQRRDAPEVGFYGLIGMSVTGKSRRNWARVGPTNAKIEADHGSAYEIYYLAQPGGGRFRLSVDGKVAGVVETRAGSTHAGYHAVSRENKAHEIEVRVAGRGEVTLFGLSVENSRSGVVVDTLGISGTRASNMLRWDAEVWADNVQRRDPALVMLAYGTNEATDEDQPIGHYRGQLRRVLQRFKDALPRASCLLVGPGDFPREIEDDVWVERPRMAQIVDVQREIAWEMGCGFWDTMAFMGGIGSMHVWATSRPRMASRDHIHLSRRGYVRLGMALTDAIMIDYDNPEP